ncbi:putative pentatricopeptide repeat-containing protein At3g25970 [Phragmites australis]|uniref:putative pentatricopeptide repeat-containing protein At3g25970 n=1 Tax=Phragmites australis TaxID=29695 RepID=UPI002D79A086|nr:putative pentatricopeptide repeat-containing protein At3g25970 [Phragmites australis]XP_062192568.1 putative pentatricopeptide repeat-containing protein At3g25970 [Phragmites australis]
MRRRHQHLALAAAKSHAALLKSGVSSPTPWNQLLTAYSAAFPPGSSLAAARRVFDEIPRPDAVSWNALLAAHVTAGAHRDACHLLRAMRARGLAASTFTLGSALRSAAAARCPALGAQLQCLAFKSGLADNVYPASALLDVYAKCGRMRDARRVFDEMPERNTVSWNALIAGYAEHGKLAQAMELFLEMESEGLVPDDATFAALLGAIDGPSWCFLMQQLHGKIMKYGAALGLVVLNAAITAYSQCGALADSRRIFDGIWNSRDLISWNAMLGAYTYHGMDDEAMRFLVRMMQESGVQPDIYSFTSMISVCSDHGCDDHRGRVIHSLVIKIGLEGVTSVSNALIAMYTRFSDNCTMEDAYKCFSSLVLKDTISWNSMLTGYSQHGLSADALRFFRCMRSANIRTDEYAFSAALRSSSDLAVLQLGRQIHSLVIQSGFASNDFVSSSLIFMYSKSGILDGARQSFEDADKSSSVPWNSMMFGYAQHGQAQTVTNLFNEMLELMVPLDHVTFVGLITAYSHAGLVDEGSEILNTMETRYGVPLRMEHYACGVDLYGRAGQLDKAKELIESMPFEPNAMVWMTLLGACRIHGNMELANNVASHLFVVEPREHSTYVLLSSMYSGLGMWSDRAIVQRVMKNRGLSKVPGWSWIEVKNEVHSFNAEDRLHPRTNEIYEMLRMLFRVAQRLSSCEDEEILMIISSDT